MGRCGLEKISLKIIVGWLTFYAILFILLWFFSRSRETTQHISSILVLIIGVITLYAFIIVRVIFYSQFMRLVSFIKRIIPTILSSRRERYVDRKLMITFLVLLFYFLVRSIPLYNLYLPETDMLHPIRDVLLGNHGTITELGIGPYLFSTFIVLTISGGHFGQFRFAENTRLTYEESTDFRNLLVLLTAIILSMSLIKLKREYHLGKKRMRWRRHERTVVKKFVKRLYRIIVLLYQECS